MAYADGMTQVESTRTDSVVSAVQIRVTLLLFASVAEAIGERRRDLVLPAGTTPRDVFEMLVRERPQLARLREIVSFARNREFAGADTILADGDELAVIPPVAGGA